MDHSSHSSQSSGVNPCTDHLTDQDYLEHMIPHHQVAVNMCYRLLKHTKNNFLIGLCYDIIREQEYEIMIMNEYNFIYAFIITFILTSLLVKYPISLSFPTNRGLHNHTSPLLHHRNYTVSVPLKYHRVSLEFAQ